MTQHAPVPGLELIMRLEATLGEPIDLGQTPHGHRRVVPITGGRINGPRFSGEVVPGGADWQIIHEGNWVAVEARYTARAEGGELVSIISRGARHGPPAVMARLMAGQSPDPSEYRFRTAISFETATDCRFAWMNQIVAVASAIRHPAAIAIDVYEVT